jgi:uncharacterized protein
MRTKSLLIVSGILLLGLVITASNPLQTGDPAINQTPLRTISVVGSGRAFLTPEIATISIGVRTENSDAAQAVEESNTQVQTLTDTLIGMGVEERDIQTSSFNIYPNQQYDETGRPISTTYVVENTVTVTVRDLNMLGELLGAAVEAGANQIYGITFDAEDRSEATSAARSAAVEDGRAKAEELATAAGVSLGELQTISEGSSVPMPFFDGRGGVAAEAAVSAVPISPGQLTLTVDVSLVFAIE